MYVRSYCFAVQMHVSLNFFKYRFYIFKVNLSIHGAGLRLVEKSKQSLAVVSLRNVASGMEKPLLWDTKVREKQAKDQYLARKYRQILFIP